MKGKRGWLFVYMVSLVLQWIGSVYFLVDWTMKYEVDGYFLTGLIQFLLLNVVMYYVLFTSRRVVIPVVICYETLVIAGQAVTYVSGLNQPVAVALAVFTSLIPILYFLRSVRVRNTYAA
jgi:hypothetical protein